MRKARHRRVNVLVQGIVLVRIVDVRFLNARNCLKPYRTQCVFRVDERRSSKGYRHPEGLEHFRLRLPFPFRERYNLTKRFHISNVIAHLPVPVVPLFRRNIFIQRDSVVIVRKVFLHSVLLSPYPLVLLSTQVKYGAHIVACGDTQTCNLCKCGSALHQFCIRFGKDAFAK